MKWQVKDILKKFTQHSEVRDDKKKGKEAHTGKHLVILGIQERLGQS